MMVPVPSTATPERILNAMQRIIKHEMVDIRIMNMILDGIVVFLKLDINKKIIIHSSKSRFHPQFISLMTF